MDADAKQSCLWQRDVPQHPAKGTLKSPEQDFVLLCRGESGNVVRMRYQTEHADPGIDELSRCWSDRET